MGIFKKSLIFSALAAGAAYLTKVFISKKEKTIETSSNTKINKEDKTGSTLSRNKRMYSDLSITKEQEKLYESIVSKAKEDWNLANPGNLRNDENNLEDEDKALNAVLDEVQYGMYRERFENY